MDYWEGGMDWPIEVGWECVVCRDNREMRILKDLALSSGLTWGIVHAQCRCNRCHAIYTMQDSSQEGRPRVTKPISMLKAEYLEPAKEAWERWHKPLDTLSDEEWAEAGVPL